MIRAFIAIDLADEVKASLRRTIAAFKAQLPDNDFGWVRIDGTHLTLRFLGDIDEGRVGEINDAIRSAVSGVSPFELHVDGTGTFPPGRRARVLWAGLAGNVEALTHLQTRIAAAIDALGFEAEDHAFRPHLTLARIRRGLTVAESQALEAARGGLETDTPRFTVSSVSLIRSELQKGGGRYTELGRAKLAS